MDSIVVAAAIAAAGTVLGAIIGNVQARRYSLKRYQELDNAMDGLMRLLAQSRKDIETSQKAMNLYHRLREAHSVNHIIAAFYLLREREVIRWEHNELLRPDSWIKLVDK